MENKTDDSNCAKISKTCYFSMFFLRAYFFNLHTHNFYNLQKKQKK